MGNQTLAQNFYQLGGAEGEHRVLARAALAMLGSDGLPPNNKAFATDMVYFLKDAPAVFQARGFLNGPGQKIQYPGRDAIKLTPSATTSAFSIQWQFATGRRPSGSA